MTCKPYDIPKTLIWEAWLHVKANQGAAGIDAETIERFEKKLGDNLYKLWNRHELRQLLSSAGAGRVDPEEIGTRPDIGHSPRSHRTALRSSRPLGSAEITHPFHPLRGQRFVVLKVRTVSGVETLSLRQAELGSFAVAREWTDWAPPGAQAVPSDGKALLIDASGLLALDQLVASLTHTVKLDQ